MLFTSVDSCLTLFWNSIDNRLTLALISLSDKSYSSIGEMLMILLSSFTSFGLKAYSALAETSFFFFQIGERLYKSATVKFDKRLWIAIYPLFMLSWEELADGPPKYDVFPLLLLFFFFCIKCLQNNHNQDVCFINKREKLFWNPPYFFYFVLLYWSSLGEE